MQYTLLALVAALALTAATPIQVRDVIPDNAKKAFGGHYPGHDDYVYDRRKDDDREGRGDTFVGNIGQNTGNFFTNSGDIHGDVTVEQVSKVCGNSQLNCCNKVSQNGDTESAGILGSVFGSGDLNVQCSPVDVGILSLPLSVNSQCSNKVVCCQGDTRQNGLVNIGCAGIAGILGRR